LTLGFAVVRAAFRLQLVALVAALGCACAAIEGLPSYSQCSVNCGEGSDATTGESGPPVPDASDDGSVGLDGNVGQDGTFVPETAPEDDGGGDAVAMPPEGGDAVGDAAAIDGDAPSPLPDGSPNDSSLPDGTIPNCSYPPDDNAGVFVTPAGSDVVEGGVCGLSRSSPCKTIGAGLASATTASGRSIVYVAAGTYTEALTLANGITVEGGWQVGGDSGTGWTFDCSSPQSLVIVQAPSSAGTTVSLTSGAAIVTTITVLSKPSSSAGQSLYGIMASGASTQLTLNDVAVTVSAGGDGATGNPGAPGAAAPANCSPGDGASGTVVGTAGGAGKNGTFGASGYVPGVGGAGGMGSAGDNGTAGGPGATTMYGTCSGAFNCSSGMASCVGGTGKPGCGGGGASGGAGGGGGGSSVALYVSGAQVTINGGSFTSGNGGKGGPGGAPGPGTPGSNGATGSTTTCAVSVCGSPVPMICQPGLPPNVTATGGSGGGTGGTGSNGGPGGGGAGGDSFAIVTANAGSVALNGSPALNFGNAGTGSGTGATGVRGAQGHF
jgi:hypothetical protein